MSIRIDAPPIRDNISRDSLVQTQWERWFNRIYEYFKVDTWQTPTLANTWVDFGSTYQGARYTINAFGWVYVEGRVKDGTEDSDVLTLPANYRPAADHTFYQAANDGAADTWAQVDVTTAGLVTMISNGGSQWTGTEWLSLDGIQFSVD